MPMLDVGGQIIGQQTSVHHYYNYIKGREFNIMAEDWSGIYEKEFPKPATNPSPRGLDYMAKAQTITNIKHKSVASGAIPTQNYIAKPYTCVGTMGPVKGKLQGGVHHG